MTPEQKAALDRIRDAGGSMPVDEFGPELRVGLVRMGLVKCTAARTIDLTELGWQRAAKEGGK
jgi:hypothetical protein